MPARSKPSRSSSGSRGNVGPFQPCGSPRKNWTASASMACACARGSPSCRCAPIRVICRAYRPRPTARAHGAPGRRRVRRQIMITKTMGRPRCLRSEDCRNALDQEGVMATPALPPERVRALIDQMAAGVKPYLAARAVGVSVTFAYGVHHKMGGVNRPPGVTYSARYLNREERYELARLRESGCSVRQAAARLGRSPSTVSRELARNADPRTGGYQPERAHRLAWERQRRPKPSRLSQHPALRAEVQQMLDRRYSPEQVSGRLKVVYPDDPAMRVSHETIYQSIYVYPRGELRRELKACLRTGRAVRRRRGRRTLRVGIVDAVPIGQRPPEVEGRLVPGH